MTRVTERCLVCDGSGLVRNPVTFHGTGGHMSVCWDCDGAGCRPVMPDVDAYIAEWIDERLVRRRRAQFRLVDAP